MNVGKMKLEAFEEGMTVKYVPYHAHGDTAHADCEIGVVTSVSDKYVFVRYGGDHHSKPTDAVALVRI